MSASQFGQLLKHLRVGKGLTLAEVAEGTGVSVPMLSRMERGERLPSAETLEALAAYFRVSSDVLTEAVVVQHAQNRYPRSWAAGKSSLGVESLASMSAASESPGVLSLTDHLATEQNVSEVRSLSAPPQPVAAARATRPSVAPSGGGGGFAVRPIEDLFADVSGQPDAALDDALHAARAAARQLVREYSRVASSLPPAERARVEAEIAQLRDALASLTPTP
jgi:transcriptional regulator with XRE-family HTH domain